MKALISTVITIGILALGVGAVVAQSGNDLFQQALVKERTDGNMAAAITLYQTIVQKYDSDRALAARALVQMGHCYDKLGQQAEARHAYERVLRDYPNQKAAVAEASAWLKAHGASASPQAGLRVEQIWAGPGVDLGGGLSADGRYLTFADWTSGKGNLAVRDLKTGENRLLTHDATSNSWAGAESLVSPDGKQIAYRWEGGKDDSIRLIGVDGTGMRVLARRGYGDFLRAWSPDGKRIAAVHYNYGTDWTVQIILISTADGSITPLKSNFWREPAIGGFSPDGRFLVYSQQKDPGATAGADGVFALAADGSREIPLVQDSANNFGPVWSPDGARVVFVSDRSGAAGLWSIQVVDGQPAGKPELLRANVGKITPRGFTRDGLYYNTGILWTDAYIADVDPETLTVTNPSLVTDRFVGSNFKPELSPDGKYVAFLRKPGEMAGPPTLMVRSLATGEERALDPRGGYGRLLWFPDSRSVFVQGYGEGIRSTFRKIGLDPADTRTLFEVPQVIWNTAALSPDGKAVFYTVPEQIGDRSGPGDLKALRLVKRRLDTGEETVLHRTESLGLGFFGLTVSSDGSRLAFFLNVAGSTVTSGLLSSKRALMVMPADGGTPREIYRSGLDGLSHSGAMVWTKDSRHLIVTGKCGPGDGEQLCAIPSEGGELRPLGLSMQEISSRMISSDGRRIAFTGVTRKQELWVIRNLLSEPTKVR